LVGMFPAVPEKVPDPTELPLPVTFTLVMELVPPVLVKVKFMMVAGKVPGLVSTTC
jgi:hypothetical protein